MVASFWKALEMSLSFQETIWLDVDSNSVLLDALKYVCGAESTESQLAFRESLSIPRLKKKQVLLISTRKGFCLIQRHLPYYRWNRSYS